MVIRPLNKMSHQRGLLAVAAGATVAFFFRCGFPRGCRSTAPWFLVRDRHLLSVAARRLSLTLGRTLKRSKEQTDDTHSSWQVERISEACFVRVYRRSRFLFSSEGNTQRLLIRSESSCRDPFSLPFRFASHLASFLGTSAVRFALHVSLKDLAV